MQNFTEVSLIEAQLDHYWNKAYPSFESFINLPSLSPAFNSTQDDHDLLVKSLQIALIILTRLN
jgi:hypothetical protein